MATTAAVLPMLTKASAFPSLTSWVPMRMDDCCSAAQANAVAHADGFGASMNVTRAP